MSDKNSEKEDGLVDSEGKRTLRAHRKSSYDEFYKPYRRADSNLEAIEEDRNKNRNHKRPGNLKSVSVGLNSTTLTDSDETDYNLDPLVGQLTGDFKNSFTSFENNDNITEDFDNQVASTSQVATDKNPLEISGINSELSDEELPASKEIITVEPDESNIEGETQVSNSEGDTQINIAKTGVTNQYFDIINTNIINPLKSVSRFLPNKTQNLPSEGNGAILNILESKEPKASGSKSSQSNLENGKKAPQGTNNRHKAQSPLPNSNSANETMALTSTQYVDIIPKVTESSNLEQFISIVDALHSEVTEAATPIFLMIVKSKILGKAFNAIKGKTISTWADIKRELVAGLEDKLDPAMASNQLVQIRQKKDESLRDYVGRIKEALADLNKVSMRSNANTAVQQHVLLLNDAAAKSTFEGGIGNRHLKTIVVAAQKTSFVESYSFAINQEKTNFPELKYEPESKGKKDNKTQKKDVTCFKCKKRGHLAPDCYSSKYNNNKRPDNNQRSGNWNNSNRNNQYENRYRTQFTDTRNDAYKSGGPEDKNRAQPSNTNRETGYAYRGRDSGKQNRYENKNVRMMKNDDVNWEDISPINAESDDQGN